MKKFILKLMLIFFFPILGIAVVAEYSIRQIPNDYSYKNRWMENNSKNINILCLGASSVFFGINPIYFNKNAFNASHVSQTLNYDNFIFNKFISQMDSLQYLVLDISYLSPFSSLEEGDEWWRAKNYSLYYSSDYHTGEIKYNYELAIHNFRVFKTAGNGLLTALELKNFSNITINELGFGINYSTKNKRKDWDTGKEEAMKHGALIEREAHLNLISENRKYVNEIIKKCANKDIKVLIITAPVCKSYVSNLNSYYLKLQKDFCTSFVSENDNVNYIDFSTDNRFVDEDFFDGNHLNEIGAKKLTIIINDKLSNWN